MHVFETDCSSVTAVTTDPGTPVDLAAACEADRERALSCYRELIEWAAGQGPRALVVVGSATHDKADLDVSGHGTQEALHRFFCGMREFVPMAERHGVDIAIENAAAGLLSSPAELRELVDQVNSGSVGVCLNLANASQRSRPKDWLTVLGRRVIALRVPTDCLNESLLTATRRLREDVIVIAD